jgi:YD repeat-containing protein
VDDGVAPDGRILERQSGDSQWLTTYTYDSEGCLLKTTSGKVSSAPTSETYYLAWKYDGDGHLIKITRPDKSETLYSYDAKGRVQNVTKRGDTNVVAAPRLGPDRANELSPPDKVTIYSYSYDESGRLARVTNTSPSQPAKRTIYEI